MIKNYFLIAVRNLLKQKGYSAINVAGLAIGMTCCLLILLYVWDELQYDRFHEKADRIYRVTLDARINNKDFQGALSCPPMARGLREELPEVEAATRVRQVGNFTVRYEDKIFNEERLFFADSNVFQVFSCTVIEGDPRTMLNRPNAVVLTDEMAKKYFGTASPMGKTLIMDGRENYVVTGVIQKFPSHSHWKFDFLASEYTRRFGDESLWVTNEFYTFAVLKPGATQPELDDKLHAMASRHVYPQLEQIFSRPMKEMEAADMRYRYRFQPLTDIHLRSHLQDEMGPNGNIVYVYIFLVIAAFILLIACINFMNLSTARSARRAKEVGVRKALGSRQVQLIQLFLFEAVLLSLIAMVFTIGLIELVLPSFNAFTHKDLAFTGGGSFFLMGGLFAFSILVGILAGSYPSFVLSAFQPIKVLKGEVRSGLRGGRMRSALVVLQFTISIVLIVGTLVVYEQLRYFQSKDLGFDKSQVLVVDNAWMLRGEKAQTFKSSILGINGVASASYTNTIPGKDIGNSAFLPEGGDQKNPVLLWHIYTDASLIPTLGLTLLNGRTFTQGSVADSHDAVIVNESAARLLGYEHPVGRKVTAFFGQQGSHPLEIIGLIKDFHFESLHQPIQPMVMRMAGGSSSYFLLRVQGNIPGIIQTIQNQWSAVTNGQPFIYFFLDEEFNSLYGAEEAMGRIFGMFAGLGIFIACLGLFGLANYAAEQRTKEIGIRKVMGASVFQLVNLLSKEFTALVLIANLIAWPIAYYAMHRWLENFAYRIDLGAGTFLLAGFLALMVALITVSYQAFKAAKADPVQSLRYE